jgi:hypothetical protein
VFEVTFAFQGRAVVVLQCFAALRQHPGSFQANRSCIACAGLGFVSLFGLDVCIGLRSAACSVCNRQHSRHLISAVINRLDFLQLACSCNTVHWPTVHMQPASASHPVVCYLASGGAAVSTVAWLFQALLMAVCAAALKRGSCSAQGQHSHRVACLYIG